jgi:hypothetical protein
VLRWPGGVPVGEASSTGSSLPLAWFPHCRRSPNAYVDLRTWCVRHGHGLGAKDHEADRWVAAVAIAAKFRSPPRTPSSTRCRPFIGLILRVEIVAGF